MTLYAEPVTTARHKSAKPLKVIEPPLFSARVITMMPRMDSALNSHCFLLGRSFRNTAAKIIVTMGMTAIMMPEKAELEYLSPYCSPMKYKHGSIEPSSSRGFMLLPRSLSFCLPRSTGIVSAISAILKR